MLAITLFVFVLAHLVVVASLPMDVLYLGMAASGFGMSAVITIASIRTTRFRREHQQWHGCGSDDVDA